jgi:putative transposase
MRDIKFAPHEFYHIYNRGVDKRDIFMSPGDVKRFLFCMSLFNIENPVGSVYLDLMRKRKELKLRSSASHKSRKLVNFIAYCLNQNHYHFILEPLVENGIQKFMHRLSTGYTNYFNEKEKRSGSLFQGRYKAKHINSNQYLLHSSVYVNLNNRVHRNLNKKWMNDLPISSFKEYISKTINSFCTKDIILGQFKNMKEYENFCKETLPEILKKKEIDKELKNMLLE